MRPSPYSPSYEDELVSPPSSAGSSRQPSFRPNYDHAEAVYEPTRRYSQLRGNVYFDHFSNPGREYRPVRTHASPPCSPSPQPPSPYAYMNPPRYTPALQSPRAPPPLPATTPAPALRRPLTPPPPPPPRSRRRNLVSQPTWDYKPTALKWWFLSSMTVVLLALLAVVEFSLHNLPTEDTSDDLTNFGKIFSRRNASPQLAPLAPAIPPRQATVLILPRQNTTDDATHNTPTWAVPTTTGPTSPSTTDGSQTAMVMPPTPTFSASSMMISGTGGYLSTGDVSYTSVGARPMTTFCFTCSTDPKAFSTSGGGPYLNVGDGTSTITTNRDPALGNLGNMPSTVTTTTPTPTPSTTTIAGTTYIPESTSSIVVITTNPAGVIVTTAVPTVIPGHLSTSLATLVVAAGQSLITTTSLIPTVIEGHSTTLSETFATVVGTPTVTSAGDQSVVVIVTGISSSAYIVGAFLPTLLAVLIALPFKLVSVNANLFQPFHALTRTPTAGAKPLESVFLRFYGVPGIFAFPRAIRMGQPAVVLGHLLEFLSALLAPLASEAVGVHLGFAECTGNCPGLLAVATVPGRALQVLLACMAALSLVLIFVLSKWRTGVRQNPWSIAGMAALCCSDDGNGTWRALLRSIPRGLARKVEDAEVLAVLEGKQFALLGQEDGSGYGVTIARDGQHGRSNSEDTLKDRPTFNRAGTGSTTLLGSRGGSEKDVGISANVREKNPILVEEEYLGPEEEVVGKKRIMSFALLTVWGRGLLLLFFGSVLILLTYYESTGYDTAFERFMDSQGFGVRFLFTAFGVLLAFCMGTFFRCVAVLSPYLLLSRATPLPAQRAILLSPPTNSLTGLYTAVRQRHTYLFILSLVTLMADFLPVTLAHVPFSLVETYETQVVCSWLSISILAAMLLVVAGSFLVRWPHMPVDPRTIAGAMFYVCDSRMLRGIDGLAAVSKRDRDAVMSGADDGSVAEGGGLRYRFGGIRGVVSGRERVGVDWAGKGITWDEDYDQEEDKKLGSEWKVVSLRR